MRAEATINADAGAEKQRGLLNELRGIIAELKNEITRLRGHLSFDVSTRKQARLVSPRLRLPLSAARPRPPRSPPLAP